MPKTSNTTNYDERNVLRGLAVIALTGSLALFGCSTNKYPGNGEPGMSAPAAGPVAPNSTSTPGSSSGTSLPPQAMMISSSPASGISASEDAIAVLKADQGYRGRVLGPAAPGNNAVVPQSVQYPTGQYVSPSMYVNPQVTVNSSISSGPTPAIVSGAGEGVGGAVLAIPATTGVTASAITAPAVAAPAATTVAATSAIRTTAATPITNTSGLSTVQAPAVNTGLTTASAAASNAAATPILTTVGPNTQANNSAIAATSAGGTTLGVTTTSPTMTNVGIAPVTARSAAATMTTAAATSDRLTLGTTTATTSTPIRVETTTGGAVVLTNEKSQSAFQRFLSAIGLRRNAVTATTKP